MKYARKGKYMKWVLLPLLSFSLLFGQDAESPPPQDQTPPPQERVPPEVIEQQLKSAEAEYNQALNLFNPYYQGPLLTPSATMTAPGHGNVQGYVFVTDNYASFNEDRKSVDFKSDLVTLNPQLLVTVGITDFMDGNIAIQGVENWQFHKSSGGFGDLSAGIGFPVLRQTVHLPGIKLAVSETFPTGKYQHLNTNGLGLDAIGGGSFQTQIGLAISKLVLWRTCHPMNLRWFFGLRLPTSVEVEGFNSYGGGFGTDGRVYPGITFSADMGIEISITQRLVFCNDIVYSATQITRFCGDPGVDATGAPASVGKGSSDNLSLAPGFEYSWTPDFGILGGVWFSVYGRNSLNFVSGIVSISYSW